MNSYWTFISRQRIILTIYRYIFIILIINIIRNAKFCFTYCRTAVFKFIKSILCFFFCNSTNSFYFIPFYINNICVKVVVLFFTTFFYSTGHLGHLQLIKLIMLMYNILLNYGIIIYNSYIIWINFKRGI